MHRPAPTVLEDVLLSVGVILLALAGAVWIAQPGPVPTTSADSPAEAAGWNPLIDTDPPITWPCNAALDVAVNLDRVPEPQRPDLLGDIDAVLADITAASPYRLQRTASSAAIPTAVSLEHVAAVADADIVIAVDDSTRSDVTDLLSADSLGTGGLYYRGPHAYVGWVLLDVNAFDGLFPGAGARSQQALIAHELLHALGVGHTRHPASLMQPSLRSATGLIADVDIAALARLNLTACAPR